MTSFPLPVEADSRLRLRTLSSLTNRIVLDVLVQRAGARAPSLIELVDVVPDGDGQLDTDEADIPGNILYGFSVRDASGTLTRGQTYARVDLLSKQGGSTQLSMGKGYVHREMTVTPGMSEDPFSGHGDVSPQVIGIDIAGNVNTTHPLDLPNQIRRVDGIMLAYHCSADADNRIGVIRIRSLGGIFPTGFDAGNDRQIMTITGPTWIVNQDGIMYWNNFGYQISIDDGTPILADNTTASNPFPFWVHPDESGAEVVFEFTDGNANDTYTGFIFGERWFL